MLYAGASASGAEKSLQQRLLQKVLESSASDVPPQLTVQAVLVLSSGSVHHLPQSDWTPSSWLQEGEDGTSLRKKLDALARGQHSHSLLLVMATQQASAHCWCQHKMPLTELVQTQDSELT